MKKITQAKINDLRKSVEHCGVIEGLPEDYVKHFAANERDGKCLYCGERSYFTWGLAHGEGHCIHCGWPARAYHFIENEGKKERIVVILQYHPDEIEVRSKSKPA